MIPKRFRSGSFVSNVATLLMGGAASQVLLLLSLPILTRMFTPADFATLAIFHAVASLIVIPACGHYDLAIVLADSPREAVQLAVLAIGLSAVNMCLLALGLFLTQSELATLLGFSQLPLWIWLMPIAIFVATVVASLTRWQTALERYSYLARCEFAGVATGVLLQLVLGKTVQSPWGVHLILGFLAGRLITVASLSGPLWGVMRQHIASCTPKNLLITARKHWRFPIFASFSELAAIACNEAPKFMLMLFFPANVLGLYALAARVLQKPVTFISAAICPAFYQRAASQRDNSVETKRLLGRVAFVLGGISIVPTVILILAAPALFELMFGQPWRAAGHYAQILAPMLLIRFVVVPTWTSLLAAGKQHILLTWNIAYLLLSSASLGLGGLLENPFLAIGLYSGLSVVMYLLLLFLNFRFLAGGQRNPRESLQPSPQLTAAS